MALRRACQEVVTTGANYRSGSPALNAKLVKPAFSIAATLLRRMVGQLRSWDGILSAIALNIGVKSPSARKVLAPRQRHDSRYVSSVMAQAVVGIAAGQVAEGSVMDGPGHLCVRFARRINLDCSGALTLSSPSVSAMTTRQAFSSHAEAGAPFQRQMAQ